MKHRLDITRNTSAKRFGRGVIRHNGTVQHLVWLGPLFIVARNRVSADAIKAAAR